VIFPTLRLLQQFDDSLHAYADVCDDEEDTRHLIACDKRLLSHDFNGA
jgi:hypothetical protein